MSTNIPPAFPKETVDFERPHFNNPMGSCAALNTYSAVTEKQRRSHFDSTSSANYKGNFSKQCFQSVKCPSGIVTTPKKFCNNPGILYDEASNLRNEFCLIFLVRKKKSTMQKQINMITKKYSCKRIIGTPKFARIFLLPQEKSKLTGLTAYSICVALSAIFTKLYQNSF